MTRTHAGALTYPGNFENVVGEVKGPTLGGELVVAVDAHYDAELDTTVVEFAFCTEADLAAIVETRVGYLPDVGGPR